MLPELTEMLEQTGAVDSIVIDNYVMKPGIYLKIDLKGNILEELVVDKDTDKTGDLYAWFKVRDYHSKLISTDKTVEKGKKIHSNNIFTLFIKTDILPEVGKAGKSLTYEDMNKALDNYFQRLEGELNKEAGTILESCDIKPPDTSICEECRKALEAGLKTAIEGLKTREDNLLYLKLFIVSHEDEATDEFNYSREGQRYVMQKIFNKNKYNVIFNGEIIGLSDENMQLNDHKPFLKLMGTRFKVPYRVSLDQALINKSLFEWLESAVREDGRLNLNFNIPYDYTFDTDPDIGQERGIFVETIPEKGKRIVVDCNNLPRDITYLRKPFKYVNYLKVFGEDNRTISKRLELEELINKTFFRNQVTIMYYDSEYKPKGCTGAEVNIMRIMSTPMKNYFRLGMENDLKAMVDKLTLIVIKDRIRSGGGSAKKSDAKESDKKGESKDKEPKTIGLNNIRRCENVRLNLLKYFAKEDEVTVADVVIDVANSVREMVLGEGDALVNNDREFYYCVGQLAYYLFDKSEAANKKMDMYTPLMEAKTPDRVKKVIEDATVRYAHNLGFYEPRYRRMLRAVLGYQADSKPDIDMILCGICDSNVIYTKTEKEEKEDEV